MILDDELVAEDRRILARALASLHRDHLGREVLLTARRTRHDRRAQDGRTDENRATAFHRQRGKRHARATHAAMWRSAPYPLVPVGTARVKPVTRARPRPDPSPGPPRSCEGTRLPFRFGERPPSRRARRRETRRPGASRTLA